jgi:hypothetical protein
MPASGLHPEMQFESYPFAADLDFVFANSRPPAPDPQNT